MEDLAAAQTLEQEELNAFSSRCCVYRAELGEATREARNREEAACDAFRSEHFASKEVFQADYAALQTDRASAECQYSTATLESRMRLQTAQEVLADERRVALMEVQSAQLDAESARMAEESCEVRLATPEAQSGAAAPIRRHSEQLADLR